MNYHPWSVVCSIAVLGINGAECMGSRHSTELTFPSLPFPCLFAALDPPAHMGRPWQCTQSPTSDELAPLQDGGLQDPGVKSRWQAQSMTLVTPNPQVSRNLGSWCVSPWAKGHGRGACWLLSQTRYRHRVESVCSEKLLLVPCWPVHSVLRTDLDVT